MSVSDACAQTGSDGIGLSRRAFIGGVGGAAALAAVTTAWPAAAATSSGGWGGGSPATASYDVTVATGWLRALYEVVRTEGLTPPAAARAYAYCSVAMYESVVDGMPAHRSLAGQLTGMPDMPRPVKNAKYDWPTALSTAVATVAGAVFAAATAPSRDAIAAHHAQTLAARRSVRVPAAVLDASQAHGRRVGAAIAEWAALDGYAGIRGRAYAPPVGPDKWVPTHPNFGTAIEPYWAEVRPFVLATCDECPPDPQPAPYSEDPASAFFAQAKTVYDQVVLHNTDETRGIARFWTDNPLLSGLPAGHWLLIVTQFAEQHALNLAELVEAYARAGVTLADAFLSCWTEKYRTNLLRPSTYVRRHIDAAWVTWVNTPQFPEYTSGHSVASNAVATVLTDLLGERPFVDKHVASGLTTVTQRSFTSFREAAAEAAKSRLYGGIHYPMGIAMGLTQGDRVGAVVVARLHTRKD